MLYCILVTFILLGCVEWQLMLIVVGVSLHGGHCLPVFIPDVVTMVRVIGHDPQRKLPAEHIKRNAMLKARFGTAGVCSRWGYHKGAVAH